MATFALGIKTDCPDPLTGRDTFCHLAAEMSRPVTTPRDTFLKILQSNFGAVTTVTTSRPFKFVLKYVGKPTSQRPNRLGRDSVTAVTPVNVKENRVIDLHATMTYNIWHEEIACGHNCSIDGRGESAAPSDVRGNGYIANGCSGACDSANGKDAEGERVMDIYYYPNGKKHEESVNVGGVVSALIQKERAKNSFSPTRRRDLYVAAGKCRGCGGNPAGRKAIAIHHVKPLWACALSFVLENPPKNYREGHDLFQGVVFGQISLPPDCSADDNLMVLCSSCHEKAESKARKHWLRFFEKKYPVKCSIK